MAEYINRERARFEAKRYFKNMDEIQEDLDMLFCMLPAENVAPVQEWISVDDRLPEKDENYLVTACDEGCSAGEGIWYSTVVVVAEYYKGSWTWYDGGHEYSLEGIVTHWQPMPEPPERGKMEE